jgi:hypothetical protein
VFKTKALSNEIELGIWEGVQAAFFARSQILIPGKLASI